MTRWNRRRFLSGSAGLAAASALPLLRASQTKAAGEAPKRLLLITTGNGSVLPNWRPQRSGEVLRGGDELSGSTSPILESLLDRHANRTILVDGLDMAAHRNAEGRVPDGGGHGAHQALWTGRYEDGRSYDGPGAADGILPGGMSIDQAIANFQGVQTAVPSLQIALRAVTRPDNRFCSAYLEGGEPLMAMSDPAEIFATLFPDQDAPSAVERAVQREERALALTRRELMDLQSGLASADHTRLSQHLQGLGQLEATLAHRATSCDAGVAPEPGGSYAERAPLHRRLINQAFACDRTRIITYSLTPEVNWIREPEELVPGWSNENGEVHHASHSSRSSASAVADMTRLKRWEADWVANLADDLAATPDPYGGSVLDHTAIVWCTAMSHGGRHLSRNTPCVIIAGDEIGWNTNQYIRGPESIVNMSVEDWYSGSVSAAVGHGLPNNQLLVSIGRAFGLSINEFGDPRWQGPLEGLV